MIERVISGGQTGADQAGWRAAKAAGIATGGYMPLDWVAEDGPHPEFMSEYGAEEWPGLSLTLSEQYRERTLANVQKADLTIWFGAVDSRGARATYRAFRSIKELDEGRDPGPVYVRDGWIAVPSEHVRWPRPEHVVEYIGKMPHRIVNIAGNRESSAPGIGKWVEAYLAKVFRLLRDGGPPP